MTLLRIALLFEYPTLNGGERSMLAALDWLRSDQREFEFIAIAPEVGRLAVALRERNIPIFHWSTHDLSGGRHAAIDMETSLVRIVGTTKPQLLHANSLAMGRITGRLATRLTIPTTSHLRDIIKLSSAAVGDLNGNKKLIAVSRATRDFHVGQGLDCLRTTVVHNGVDLERFRPRASTGQLLKQLGPVLRDHGSDNPEPRSPKLIATIGQIGLRKGQDVLAQAAPLIVARLPDAHFILIGERTSLKDESIEFESSLKQAFELAGLANRLHCLGHREDVDEILNEIDLLVHPANQEPFGRVLLEASAAGVPIVATDVGGTSEIIVDRVTGYLVPPRDPESLAKAAIAILTDDVEAARLRITARERAVREFAIPVAGKNLASVWRNVLLSETSLE